MKIKRTMPPLFGVTTVNNVYCDIITNMNVGMSMNSITRNVIMPLLMIIITLPFIYLCFSLLEENDLFLFLGLAGIVLIYFCIYALRCALTHPKMLIIRLNRQQKKVYIQKHHRTFNIFVKWPIETLIYDWNLIEAHFGHRISRYYGHFPGTAGMRLHPVATKPALPLAKISYRHGLPIPDLKPISI